jgi:protein O-GlcNAc transferase
MNTKSKIPLICGLAALLLSVAFAQDIEPTVSRAEAEALNAAQGLAETNLTAAVAFLREQSGSDSSAALDFALGNFLFQNEELEQAAAAYSAAIDKLPLFQRALENLGRVHLLREDAGQALAVYRKLVENGLATAESYALLAQTHLLRENYVSAENAFRHCLLLKPDDREAKLGLAKCLLQQRRLAESRALVAELLAATPAAGELWSLRANISLAMDRADEALTAIESARRLGAADAQMLATLGDIYLNREQPRQAVAAYRESFAAQPPAFDRLLMVAQALLSLDAVAEAESFLQQAGQSGQAEDRQSELLGLRGEIALQQGDPDRAAKIYRRALKLDPLDGELLTRLARIEWERGNIEEAIIICEQAARIRGSEHAALLLHAQIEVECGNYPQALPLLERALAFRRTAHVERYREQVRRLAAEEENIR